MTHTRTELVFILDRSGSMGGLESDTIGGFNSTLLKQKREPGEALITTVLFDDQYERFTTESPSRPSLRSQKETITSAAAPPCSTP